ncbi:MAG: RidA family protein [Sphaerochaetaceae bacterium]
MQFFTGWKEKNSRNHAVRIDGLIYSSGVRPIDPQTGKLIENRDFSAHMSQCLDNLDVILREAGATVQNVVKLTVYLRNMRNADNVAQEVAKRFDADKMPTATILEMHRFEDDLDVLIHCIAADSSVEVTHYEDKRYAPWSGAVAYGDYISLSAVVPEATSITYDQKMFADEVAACFTEMERLLQKAGSDVQHALRMRVYVRNMLDRIIVNEVTRPLYEKFPLRVIVEPARLMHEQRIAIECDAYKKDDMEHLRTEKGQLPTGPFSQGNPHWLLSVASGSQSNRPGGQAPD